MADPVVDTEVRLVFKGLDDGLLEYLVSMVEDMDPDFSEETLIEGLVPFLESAGFIGECFVVPLFFSRPTR